MANIVNPNSPTAKKLWLSRTTLNLGAVVIAATTIITFIGLIFAKIFWELFFLGLAVGIGLIAYSQTIIAGPSREPNKITHLTSMIAGYAITTVAAMITLYQFYFSGSLARKVMSLFFIGVGIALINWSKQAQK